MAEENGKTYVEINIPNEIFFPDWNGERLTRRIYCQDNDSVPAGGTGYVLLFGLPLPALDEMLKVYLGIDDQRARKNVVSQHSYAKDSPIKKAVVESGIDWAELVPEDDEVIKGICKNFQEALITAVSREPGKAAKDKAKASELDQSIKEFGLDPEDPEDRETYRSIVKAIAAKQRAKIEKAKAEKK